MATKIEWAATPQADGMVIPGETWNPTVGCNQISPGCGHCYAKSLHDKRHKAFLAGKKMAPQYAVPFETLQLIESRLDVPLRAKKPTTYFVNSMSDLFHEDVPDAFIDRVFAVMALAPRHTFQVLTKRAERMRDYASDTSHHGMGMGEDVCTRIARALSVMGHEVAPAAIRQLWPLPNVWLGPSIENQHFADIRFPIACELGEAGWHVMVSMEPLLGPVAIPARFLALGRRAWVIVGGESGAGARPCAVEWIESVVAQCRAASVPAFVKQLGAYVVSEERTMPAGDVFSPAKLKLEHFSSQQPDEVWAWRAGLRDRKGGDPSEWPTDLRVRQFPVVRP
jgi:protein gp37